MLNKILVTGGSGFLGSHLVDKLIKKNYSVIVLDKKNNIFSKKNYKFYKFNLSRINSFKKILKDVSIVYHFAGFSDLTSSKYNPIRTIKDNIESTILLLKACNENGVKKFIFASSIYSMSAQGSYYACSKRAAEDYIIEYCNNNKISYSILRFGTIFGPRSDLNNGVKQLIYNGLKNNSLVYNGTYKAEREYIHVEDATEGCIKCINRFDKKIIKITGYKKIKVTYLIDFLKKKLKISKVRYLNNKNNAHYDKEPTPYQLRKDKKLKLKNYRNFYRSIEDLINETKEKYL